MNLSRKTATSPKAACWLFGTAAMLGVSLSGCSGPTRVYDGARLAATEECQVYGEDSRPPSDKPARLLIRSVDGETLSNHWIGKEGAAEVALKPGRHEIRVQYHLGGGYFDSRFSLDCERGAQYVAKAKVEGYRARIWLENAATGVMAGELLDR